MRLVYRNRRAALVGMLCVFGVMMLLMKYTELGPTCMFREEQPSIMLRDEVSEIFLSLYIHINKSLHKKNTEKNTKYFSI